MFGGDTASVVLVITDGLLTDPTFAYAAVIHPHTRSYTHTLTHTCTHTLSHTHPHTHTLTVGKLENNVWS